MIRLDQFIERHHIKILDTQKRAYRFNGYNTKYFQFADDYNKIIRDPVTHDTEPLYTLEISKSELEKLAKFEMEVMNHLRDRGHYNMFEDIMVQKEKENFYKEKYVAVKKAYENYSLLLKMAESGEL
jgi:hypothetical protein